MNRPAVIFRIELLLGHHGGASRHPF
jgi:hypothetical protein